MNVGTASKLRGLIKNRERIPELPLAGEVSRRFEQTRPPLVEFEKQ